MIAPRFLFALLVAPLMATGVAHATPIESSGGGTIISLTPEQVETAKEAAAERNAKAAGIYNGSVSGRQVHGEMGVAIGTGGYRSVFGTAVMPLGQDGLLALSFENSQGDFGRYGYRRR